MKNFFKGFTLIEVLVVVSIISILAAVLYASFGEARTDARNKAVQAELKEVQLALELYKAQEGRYASSSDASVFFGTPVPGCSTYMTGYFISSYDVCDDYDLPPIEGLVEEGFLPDFPDPDDSANEDCDYEYIVDENGEWYKLVAKNCHGGASDETEGIQPENSEFARCPDIPSCNLNAGACDTDEPVFYNSYAIYSDGAQCE